MERLRRPAARWLIRLLWVLLAALCLRLLLRIPMADLLSVLRRLDPLSVCVILAVNLAIVIALPLRLSLLTRATGNPIPYHRLLLYRWGAAAISYVTPGPQFGGEPFQYRMLKTRERLTGADSAAITLIDRGTELVANLVFLLTAIVMFTSTRLEMKGLLYLGLAVIVPAVSLPVIYLWLLRRGARPVARIVGCGTGLVLDALCRVENRMATLASLHYRAILLSLLLSLALWIPIVAEYNIVLRALGINLAFVSTVQAMALPRLALLSPIPGAVAVLEAAQVFGLQALGFGPAEGLGVGLLVRVRDIVFAVLGLAAARLAAVRPLVARSASAGI